jgi:hypothetical protein
MAEESPTPAEGNGGSVTVAREPGKAATAHKGHGAVGRVRLTRAPVEPAQSRLAATAHAPFRVIAKGLISGSGGAR